MMTDPIADMLTRVRNAVAIDAPLVDMPYSRIKREIARVLTEEGFFVQYEVIEGQPQATLRIQIKYGPDGERIIRKVKRVSKPGCRVYRKSTELRPVLGGLGIAVLSTNAGVMSDRQARVRKVGGEVLGELY
ncbi:MAG: 30S ribosomal protein S8 [Planctomycetia bacterium]